MAKPKSIFHYTPANLQTLQNLKMGKLYFNKPVNFNDPHDCFNDFDYFISDNALEKFKKHKIKDNGNQTPYLTKHLRTMDIGSLRDLMLVQGNKIISELIQSVPKTFGVACFSETKDNLLMWAHYAAGFTGICLEFDTSYEPFNKMRKVKYTNDKTVFDLGKLLDKRKNKNENSSEIAKVWATKSKIWSYEKEWRSVHKDGNTLFSYDQSALRAIYFGDAIKQEILEIICLIMIGQNEHVRFYKSKISKVSKKVEFELIPFYIPHLVAKKLGLK